MFIEYNKLSLEKQYEVYRRYENIVDKEVDKVFDSRHDYLVEELNSTFGCCFENDDIVINNHGVYGISIYACILFYDDKCYPNYPTQIISDKLLKDFARIKGIDKRIYHVLQSLIKNGSIYFYLDSDLNDIEIDDESGYKSLYKYPRVNHLINEYADFLRKKLNELISDCEADIDYYCNESDFVDEVFEENYLFDEHTLKIKPKQQ